MWFIKERKLDHPQTFWHQHFMPEENGATDIWDTQGEKMWTKDIISGKTDF